MAKRFRIVTEISPEKAERYRNTSMIFTLRPGQAQALAKMRNKREQAEEAKEIQPLTNHHNEEIGLTDERQSSNNQ